MALKTINVFPRPEACVVCGSPVKEHCRALIRGKHEIGYFICTVCGTIQSEEPYWLSEAYAEAINRSDIGYISRNLRFRNASKLLIDLSFKQTGPFLDYGSGYGMYVRLMRDAGYNFWGHDAYCKNLFSPDFLVSAVPPERYELVTAFEVMEHLPEPRSLMECVFNISDNFLFSTELVPKRKYSPHDWPYFGLDHGQHITFYTKVALQTLGEAHGATYYQLGPDLHLLAKNKVSRLTVSIVGSSKLQKLYSILPARQSLLTSDHAKILKKIRDEFSVSITS